MASGKSIGARTRARELLLQALYQKQIAGHDQKELLSQFREQVAYDRVDQEFFDEALAAIGKTQQALEKLMKNRTALVVAHRLSTVRHADRIIVLNRGRIIETGNHTELMHQKGFYFKLHQLQNGNHMTNVE